jgi:glycerol-3-phosphate acyltransferase PlsY
MSVESLIFIIISYLIGSISTAIIVCRLMGLEDPRKDGSGNPGATNVKRLYGNKPAALTLFGDMIKGVIPVVAANALGYDATTVILVGFAAFIGHLYPVFFGFRGGKGVATMMGVLLAVHFWVGLAVVATWLFVAKVLKISSLSALVAAVLAPVYFFWLSSEMIFVQISVLMSAILIWRHKSNIQRLINGEEDLIKKK